MDDIIMRGSQRIPSHKLRVDKKILVIGMRHNIKAKGAKKTNESELFVSTVRFHQTIVV